jgi:hypothetical protein
MVRHRERALERCRNFPNAMLARDLVLEIRGDRREGEEKRGAYMI